MIKLVTSSTLVALLCGPALADATLNVGFVLTSGNQARHYGIKLADRECGSVESSSPQQHDEIHACVKPDGNGLRLELDWKTRDGDHEIRNRSVVVATRGQIFDLDNNGAKLTVSIQ